ncbi:hypothetical protein PMZ80_004772 [Knufia obscura]|uniref:Uncharacterized protein n=1 Tax=Knufia obscura TaxID=1635080 RepID=A0ABR0RU12_9EURO|nr:hypothetical protein PMZ80_004772 [Knufia obscura]
MAIYPIPDRPWFLPGFSAACGALVCTLIGYASLPFWLLWEARRRKKKYGHAMPLRALDDAQHAHISDAARAREQEQAMREEKQQGDRESSDHLEEVEMR